VHLCAQSSIPRERCVPLFSRVRGALWVASRGVVLHGERAFAMGGTPERLRKYGVTTGGKGYSGGRGMLVSGRRDAQDKGRI